MLSKMTSSYVFQHMDKPVLADQQSLTFTRLVQILDAILEDLP